jgi:hypothetical protein
VGQSLPAPGLQPSSANSASLRPADEPDLRPIRPIERWKRKNRTGLDVRSFQDPGIRKESLKLVLDAIGNSKRFSAMRMHPALFVPEDFKGAGR